MKKILLLLFATTTIINSQNYQFLGSYTSNGTPLYLENPGDTVSGETLQMIDDALPESYPVPDYNPHYISSGYETDLIINQTADVWVTFISEGAGYRNVLGFYTYDVNNPSPTAPQAEDITIIFPNASALYSGGGLQVGDKVKLGTFNAGTGIGWVLLANAWNSSASTVGNGLWQLYSNPDYNPEAQTDLRYHNVLLNDPDNERIILGFEDIRRDYSSCDNDFNDAIFYVTANPYAAMVTTNYADVSSASNVTSGNDGGLESNGSLASLIAKRNFKRKQTGAVFNKKGLQTVFNKQELTVQSNSSNTPSASLENYIPNTGMFGTETAYVSSPTDLLEITNATEVFSVDFYQDETRVSAVLATVTEGSIYDHSKMICDRLNNSVLEDIRTVTVRGHQMISSKIIRATGETEYALSFSVKLGELANELYSLWTIEQYPEGDFYNFQTWGNNPSQVFTIVNHIIDTLTLEKPLNSETLSDVIPPVFVSSGHYSNGNIHLNIINKVNVNAITFSTSTAATEVADRVESSETVSLNGSWNDTVIISTGQLFDIGFSLSTNVSTQQDALYLADGPWGIDYLEDQVAVEMFNIENNTLNYNSELYQIERQPSVSGDVKGTINLFRHVLPGEQTLDVSNYSAFQFKIINTQPIELVLMQEGLIDWNNRLRLAIPENSEETFYNISFSDFVDGNGNSATITDVKTIVFSLQGDYNVYEPFAVQVDEVAFGSAEELNLNKLEKDVENKLSAIPNPMNYNTTIHFNSNQIEVLRLVVYDQLGKLVYQEDHETVHGKNEILVHRNNLTTGIYFCKIISKQDLYTPLKLIVR